MAVILVTGGTGLIGTALTRELLHRGHVVRHMSRTARGSQVPTFTWDIHAGRMDDAALEDVDHVVHLAGAGIADKRWTAARVNELIASRARSIHLLHDRMHANGVRPNSVISAAGINYYGAVTTDHIFTEDDPPGKDTIAYISKEWEEAVDECQDLCRVVKLRTGVVLAREGGALPKLVTPIRLGLGAPLGPGRQWMPWVHIQDVVRAYLFAIERPIQGAFNLACGEHVTNAVLMRELARVLRRPFFLPAVPAFVLKVMLGRLSSVLLHGSRASGAKLESLGFRPVFRELDRALEDLLLRR